MSWSKLLVIALGGALLAGPAFADDDDDLMQLSPKKKPAAKPKPKPAKPKPAPVVKPAPVTATPDDDLAPLTPKQGELALKFAAAAAPRRAKVSIDGNEVGTMPIANQWLNVGEHTIVVRAPGHAMWTKKVTVTGEKTNEVVVTIEPNAALVSVTADAPGAQVTINGKPAGNAPIEELEVPPGAATIVVRKEGYKESSQTLKLIAGKDYPISVKLGAPVAPTAIVANTDRPENTNLTPKLQDDLGLDTTVQESKPIYTRWYFWVGAVAVVAAVAVGTTVGVSASQPKPLGEKQICGDSGCDSCIGFMCAQSLSGSQFAPLKF